MVESLGAIQIRAAGSKKQQVGAPAAADSLVEQALRVMRANTPLEAVQKQQPRRAWWAVDAVDIQKIAVRCFPTLDACRGQCLSAKELSPQCLQVATGNPPRGRINYVSAHCRIS